MKIIIPVLLVFGALVAHAQLAALPSSPPIPADNPMSAAKISLGKQLYFDKRLSRTGEVSCNSCHNVSGSGIGHGSGTDNAAFSTGVEGKKGGRHAPTVWNAALMSAQFWDGRAATLEDQAKGPMINPVEMGNANHDEVVKRIAAVPGYVKQFKDVFGDDGLVIDNVAKAIAAYERTLLTPNAPFDRYMAGQKKAMSASAVRGMKLVQSVGCTSCHMGQNFAGPALPVGQGFYMKFPTFPNNAYVTKYHLTDDPGRYNVTKNEADRNMWRVPTWRNVEFAGPYFHNGSVATLDEAVRVMAKVQLGKTLKAGEVRDIVAFLKSLSGERPIQTVPTLPE